MEYDGEPNGLKIHKDGRIFIADNRNGIIVLDLATKRVEPFVTRVANKRLRGPNDLSFSLIGDLYFTDQGNSDLQRPNGRVIRCKTDGASEIILTDIPSPNGLVLSPKEDFLYTAVTRTNNVWRTPLEVPPGMVSNSPVGTTGVFIQLSGGGGPDGMADEIQPGLRARVLNRHEGDPADANALRRGRQDGDADPGRDHSDRRGDLAHLLRHAGEEPRAARQFQDRCVQPALCVGGTQHECLLPQVAHANGGSAGQLVVAMHHEHQWICHQRDQLDLAWQPKAGLARDAEMQPAPRHRLDLLGGRHLPKRDDQAAIGRVQAIDSFGQEAQEPRQLCERQAKLAQLARGGAAGPARGRRHFLQHAPRVDQQRLARFGDAHALACALE